MKTPRILIVAAVAAVLPLLTQCASMSASTTEPLLSAAGFRVVSPETPEQRELYASLPPYKVQRGIHDGRIFYAYKDEQQGVAYVGGEMEYQRYEELAIQRRIAQDQYMAAQMNATMAYRWYGAYPHHYRW